MSKIPLVAIFSYIAVLCLSVFSCVNMASVQTAPMVSATLPTVEEQQARRIAKMAMSWSKHPDYRQAFNPLTPTATKGGGASYASFDPDDDYWGLPREGAYEDVSIYCSACHTLEIVMQQRASRDRWAYMLDWMVEEQKHAANA